MPTYEYACSSCPNTWEEVQKITEPALVTCPACKKATAKRQISGGAFILKGGGWYADAYSTPKKSDSSKSGDSGSTGSSGTNAGSGSSSESKGDGGAKSAPSETKSESKKESTAPSSSGSSSSGGSTPSKAAAAEK